jgi:hypothetical protein
VRDRAVLMVGFASGGRRGSEIVGLRVEPLAAGEPVSGADGTPLPSLSIHLGRTKTSGADHDEVVYLTGRPVDALRGGSVCLNVSANFCAPSEARCSQA